MKIYRYILIFALLLTLNNCFSQSNDALENYYKSNGLIIKTNPIIPFYNEFLYTGEYRIIAERNLFGKHSIQLGAGYLGKSVFLLAAEEAEDIKTIARGAKVYIAYKYYLISKDNNINGLYISPLFTYSTVKISTAQLNTVNYHIRGIKRKIHFHVGFQKTFSSNFTFDVFTGIAYKNSEYLENDISSSKVLKTEDFEIFPNRAFFDIGFNIGLSIK